MKTRDLHEIGNGMRFGSSRFSSKDGRYGGQTDNDRPFDRIRQQHPRVDGRHGDYWDYGRDGHSKLQQHAAHIQARSAVAELASTLRMARQLAMARRERLLVQFDLSGKTVILRPADSEGVLEVYRYGDKGIVLDEPTAGLELFFQPSGRSASATTIIVHDSEDRRTTVTVSLTGRVVIS